MEIRPQSINTILQFIENRIREAPSQALAEHTLLSELSQAGKFDFLTTQDASLRLFQKHFLCMHALYALQKEFYNEGQYLEVGPLKIQLRNTDDTHEQAVGKADQNLSAYYADLTYLQQATADTVTELQMNFAKRYQAWMSGDEAYTTLKLNKDVSWDEIRAQYRRLAALHHPDKGGDANTFARIRQAFEHIKSLQE